MKSELEICQKLDAMCLVDATHPPDGVSLPVFVGCKVGAVKALLWALGVNDDDSFHVPARPGKPVKVDKII